MNTDPSSLSPSSSLKSPEPIKMTTEEVRLNELFQMAIQGTFAPEVTAADLAAAKWKVWVDQVGFQGGEYEPDMRGGESVLHEAADRGHYPPGTSLQLLAETVDARNDAALDVALRAGRDRGIPLPDCCTGPALARLKPKFDTKSWLHRAVSCELTPPGTTPALLINTSHEGWTALHAAADSGHVISGTTLRMLMATVTPATGPSVANFSAWDGFKERVDQELAELSQVKIPLSTSIINSTKHLLVASIESVPNLESLAEVRALAEFFQPIAPVETALWVAAELVWHQQKLINGHDAS